MSYAMVVSSDLRSEEWKSTCFSWMV